MVRLMSDGKAPNAICCQEKGIDGCYECDDLEGCKAGFCIPSNDGVQAAKAQVKYIRKYGKQEFLKVHDRLHQKYDFAKTQEILGQDCREELCILEENKAVNQHCGWQHSAGRRTTIRMMGRIPVRA